MKLAVDFEFASRRWWEEGGQDLWEGLTDTSDESSVVVEASVADSWLLAAEKISGWDEGHEFAPHPIQRLEVAEDDVQEG